MMKRCTGIVVFLIVGMLAISASANQNPQEIAQNQYLRQQYEEQREEITHAGEYRNSETDSSTLRRMRDAEIKTDDAVPSGTTNK